MANDRANERYQRTDRAGCPTVKPRFVSRRDFLFNAGSGISGLAFAAMLQQQGLLGAEPGGACNTPPGFQSPYAPKPSHFAPRAKSVISLFMSGGVSHVDTFDPKPMLDKFHGEPLEGKGRVRVRQGYPGPLMRSPFGFKKHGKSGIDVSNLFPHMATKVDDLAFIRSAQGRSNDHVLAHYEWNTGSLLMGYPSVGSWVAYGLGTENQSLPGFVVVYDYRGGPFSGPTNWSSGFLPATYQGTVFRSSGDPVLDLNPPPEHVSPEQQRARLDHLAWLNEEHARRHPGSSELAARIASYELAFRMQTCAPDVVDISKETEKTKRLYGMDHPTTEPFGKQCLLARRLVERGVRFVQLYNGALRQQNIDTWDAHSNLVENHTQHAAEVDKPMAGLIEDLKQRGMLDDTLVLWHSEFGRMPISQRGVGRDHNPGAMTIWMAGAGIQGGQVIGSTDEFGYKAIDPITHYDLHATLLHLLGMDHKRLTYFFNGRHMRLTDVHGEVIPQIVS